MMPLDAERFVAALERRGAAFVWLQGPDFGEFFLNLDAVEVAAGEEVSIRYALFDHYEAVRAYLFTREVRH
jgi:hypothetical protein